MMSKMLMNGSVAADNAHEEFRVAILKGTKLHNLFIDRPDMEEKKGNIYKAIVRRVEPSLEAVFVDYGTDRHGFLPFKEIAEIYLRPLPSDTPAEYFSFRDRLQEGMELMVQVDKEERGNKGAALTSFISLAGCYLVLMPNSPDAGGISRRIEGEEREELKAALAALDLPDQMGVIIRTAGVGKSIEELQWDLKNLLNHWQAIQKAYQLKPGPFLIHRESDIIVRAIRDYLREDVEEILVDNYDVFTRVLEDVQRVRPDFAHRVKLYQNAIPLFSRHGVEGQIESAFQHEVRLPSGGVIVIDHTEALVSIDINSSRSTRGGDIEETALHTNLEAADEIARQLRLRDIGGLIVIDFIDMMAPNNQRRVEERLRDALSADRARVQIGRISRFGLLEMSRQRLRTSLGESTQSTCPRCQGHGSIRSVPSVALSILRLIEEDALKEGTSEVRAQLPIDIATFLLNEKRETVHQIQQRHQVRILIIPNAQLESPNYKIDRFRSSETGGQRDNSYQMRYNPEKAEITAQENKPRRKVEEPAVKQVMLTEPHPALTGDHKPGILKRIITSWFSHKSLEEEQEEQGKREKAAEEFSERRPNNMNRRHPNQSRGRYRQRSGGGHHQHHRQGQQGHQGRARDTRYEERKYPANDMPPAAHTAPIAPPPSPAAVESHHVPQSFNEPQMSGAASASTTPSAPSSGGRHLRRRRHHLRNRHPRKNNTRAGNDSNFSDDAPVDKIVHDHEHS